MAKRSIDNNEAICATGVSKHSSTQGDSFMCIWNRFQNSTPGTYRSISMDLCRTLHGPELPEKAFDSLDALKNWYNAVLLSWLGDSLLVADYWRGKLPAQEHELALSRVAIEAAATGMRRLQRRILRKDDGIPRQLPINTYSELSKWCDFVFQLLEDDEQYIGFEREVLTIRYDKGVAYRVEEERKETNCDEWVADTMHNMKKALNKTAKPYRIEPDDEWLLTVWSKLADTSLTVREATVSLFIDAQSQPNQPHRQLFSDIVSATWKVMRRLGPVCHGEREVTSVQQVREQLDAVKLFCSRKVSQLSITTASTTQQSIRVAPGTPDNQALEQSLIGYMHIICAEAHQIYRDSTKFDYGIDGEIEFKDDAGNATGKKIYVQLKNGSSYLRKRQADGKEIFDVNNLHHIDYWRSQPVDVYLVIKNDPGLIRWMNVTHYLNERDDKASRQIVFSGEKLDKEAILRVRDGLCLF